MQEPGRQKQTKPFYQTDNAAHSRTTKKRRRRKRDSESWEQTQKSQKSKLGNLTMSTWTE